MLIGLFLCKTMQIWTIYHTRLIPPLCATSAGTPGALRQDMPTNGMKVLPFNTDDEMQFPW